MTKKIDDLHDIQNDISRYFAQKPIYFHRSGIENLHTRWQKVVDNESGYIIDENKFKIYLIEFNAINNIIFWSPFIYV